MFYCRFCRFHTSSFKLHLEHHNFHRNITVYYYCGYEKCNKFFSVESYLAKHLFRTHRLSFKKQSNPNAVSIANERGKFVCNIQICGKAFDCHSNLITHLKNHMTRRERITCPYDRCNKKYTIVSSFTSHMSKIHRHSCNKNQNVDVEESENCTEHDFVSQNPQLTECNEPHVFDASANEDVIETEVQGSEFLQTEDELSNLFLENVAQFYLKLESQYLIPSSTIQYIVREGFKIHGEGQSMIKKKLSERLSNENIAPEKVDDILKEIFNLDPIVETNEKLKTSFKRKKFYKEHFDYIDPVSITIDEEKKNSFVYVPIIDTLKSFFRDKSVYNDLQTCTKFRENGVLRDFTDGMVYKNNSFFNDHPNALEIILYQDAFEIVNPLGAAKKKYKLLAIYMTLGNLPDHLRSHVNSIKLVALCKKSEFIHKKVYGKVVEDLKKIEQEGIEISGRNVKGTVVFISGDNLGSHSLGGFLENFSVSKYFCRYCLIEREKFQSENGAFETYPSRSVELYNALISQNENNDNCQGIKFNSIFNELQYYHVCAPGLPPCIGHDLFEGIVAFDLKLYIDYLIAKKWFTLRQLNKRIDQFSYTIEDKIDQPCKIPIAGTRIIGGACQIWTFLILFPLLINDKICDVHDEVWHCILLLTEIVEIVCSPAIHESYLPYLHSIVEDYIYLRQKLFPNNKLRPKHHYISHYAKLISEFGPLIKVWTMRFESKHRFFKIAIRNLHNFINVLKSLAEKHELFQSLIRLGSDIRLGVEVHDLQDLQIHLYHENIQTTLRNADLPQGIQECGGVNLKGTTYKKGSTLMIRQAGYQCDIVIGKICLLLWDNDTNVYAVFEILKHEFIPHLRAYKLCDLRVPLFSCCDGF